LFRQKGVTLAEIMIVTTVMATFAMMLWPKAERMYSKSKLDGAIEQARQIANVAEKVRITSIGTTIIANNIHTQTYQTLPANSTTNNLGALIGSGNGGFPLNSPYKTPYRIEITASEASATFYIPEVIISNSPNVKTTTVAGGVDITVYAIKKPRQISTLLRKQRKEKVYLYLETTR